MYKQFFSKRRNTPNGNKADRIQRKTIALARFVEEQLLEIKNAYPDLNFEPPKISVYLFEGDGTDGDVELRPVDQGIDVFLNWKFGAKYNETRQYHIAAFCFWLVNCDSSVQSILVDTTDGQARSLAKYSPSSFRKNVVLLPDSYFFKHRGFINVSNYVQKHNVKWCERDANIVWRGGVNGIGYTSFDKEMEGRPALLQRIAMVNLLRDTDADAKFLISNLSSSHQQYLEERKVLGTPIQEMSWINRKYAIDIDGFTNTWSNLIIRMKLGCCVFKIASPYGFRQWYYDRLQPFEHYIPVAADLSDWFEKLEWAHAHPAECEEIARAGQELANSMTFQSETQFAARRIEGTWRD